jgi:hypothetical protein
MEPDQSVPSAKGGTEVCAEAINKLLSGCRILLPLLRNTRYRSDKNRMSAFFFYGKFRCRVKNTAGNFVKEEGVFFS